MAQYPLSQGGYGCRLAWGRRGAAEAAARGDIVVIVDVLCFSTTVATAVQYGGIITACVDDEEASRVVASQGGTAARGREAGRKSGQFSLSPLSYIGMKRGAHVALPSPNGAACTRLGAGGIVLAGALVNASAVAWAVEAIHSRRGRGVTIVACGERWNEPEQGEGLRVAIEDYLGAGAIISRISLDKSPEAWVCAGAFLHAQDNLRNAIWESGSGQELRTRGYADDVRHAARLNIYGVAPRIRNGMFVGPGDKPQPEEPD